MNARQYGLFPGFAGVALADILANSVAIIIIMIVVTIFIKHEQEQEQLEQTEEVSVLLSREIANSVIMNALPASPPVRLHDYTVSPLDRNPQHSHMPIIELHNDYIRNYYTGKRITRDELLRQDNRFDRYIRSLTREQLLFMRVDIYSIRLFYIVMSILKSYNHSPRHWHFLAYSDKQKNIHGNEDDALAKEDFATRTDTEEEKAEEKNNDAGQGSNIADNMSTSDKADDAVPADNSTVPQQAVLFSAPGDGDNSYPYDDLAFKHSYGADVTAPADLPGSSEEVNPLQEESNLIFNTLAQMMQQSLAGERFKHPQEPTLSRFRSADPDTARLESGEKEILLTGADAALDMETLLPAIFDFMQEVQKTVDSGGDTTQLARYDFKRDILDRIPNLQPLSDPEEMAFFANLTAAMQNLPQQKKETLFVTTRTSVDSGHRNLALAVNQRIRNAVLINDLHQSDFYDLPAEVNISSRMNLYPEIYQGLRLPLLENMLILMPPQQAAPATLRWRVVTLVSPMLDDFVTAFVYAAMDQDRLLVSAEENALKISNLRVTTNYLTLPFRQERWQILFYGLVAALVLFGIFHRRSSTR